MSFWSAVVAIVAIIAFTVTRVARYRAGSDDPRHHRRHGTAPEGPTQRELELQREVEDLRERLTVLERIATEDRHSKAIAAEIESLRDS